VIAHGAAIRDPVAVLRVVVPLLVATGCDLVFTLEAPPPVSACGTYRDVEQLAFGPDLEDVTDFSVDDTGMTGFVMARSPIVNRQRITAIQRVDGVWVRDPTREANLEVLTNLDKVTFGRIAPNGEAFLANRSQAEDDFRVFRYILNTNGWGSREQVSPTNTLESTFAGGEIEINDGFGPDRFFRHIPILHASEQGERFLSIASSEPLAVEWFEPLDEGRLITEEINERHEVTMAALALGPSNDLVMAYAALPEGATAGSQLFLTEKDGKRYPVGALLDELDEPGDEVEPFLSRDCSKLFYRRGDAIFMAQPETAIP